MLKKTAQIATLLFFSLAIVGCASYSITEQELTQYLQDNVQLQQSVGVENVMYAEVAVDNINVEIGRSKADRISIFTNTSAKVNMLSAKNISIELDIEFSAIPKYEPDSGEVFLKSIRLERFDQHGQTLLPEMAQFLKPAVFLIGQALSMTPIYQLDSTQIKQALLKSTNPNLIIKDNKLVIEL